jgi:hypothetical protein
MLKGISSGEALSFNPHEVFNDSKHTFVTGIRKLPD